MEIQLSELSHPYVYGVRVIQNLVVLLVWTLSHLYNRQWATYTMGTHPQARTINGAIGDSSFPFSHHSHATSDLS